MLWIEPNEVEHSVHPMAKDAARATTSKFIQIDIGRKVCRGLRIIPAQHYKLVA